MPIAAGAAGQRARMPRRCCFHATGDIDVIARWTLLAQSSRFLARIAALAVVVAQVALAQDVPAPQGDEEQAARVGRVSLFQGQLFIAPPDKATEWEAVTLNYPVATGDNLWMSGDGRAEVDYGGGQLRLGGDSNVHVSRLDDRQLALFVAEGRVVLRVRTLEPGETVLVDTPNAQLELRRPGLYRIDVAPDPAQTWLLVREGEANVALPSGVSQVLPGQIATIAGVDNAVVEVGNGVTVDALDTWSADRDRVYEGGRRATSYVSPEMVGYADLEANGQWQTYPDYGPVWFPSTVVADWAPYRYGHWVWLSAYGWTWVDDAPWGYAPFHYGRWAYVGGRWGWCPGTYVRRPVWAPALVAWYGGSGWSVSVSAGRPVFGWVPLGWRDPFVPWWGRCGSRCYERYNHPYAVNVAERPNRPPTYYANSRVPGAITAVPGAAFRGAKPVAANRVTLPPQALASAPLLARAPQVKPLPVTTNVVPAGRGAPLPAAQIAARVKPMAVSPNTQASGSFAPRGTPMPGRSGAAAVNPVQRPVTSAPAVTAVPPAQRPMTGTPGVTAVPPAQRPVTSAPGAAYDPRHGRVEASSSAPVVRPAPQGVAPPSAAHGNAVVNPAPQARPAQREANQRPAERPMMRAAPQPPASSPPARVAPAAPAPVQVAPPPPPAPPRAAPVDRSPTPARASGDSASKPGGKPGEPTDRR
jgi:hypothetical protein